MQETPFLPETLDSLRHAMAVFANERGWERYHTPVRSAPALGSSPHSPPQS